LNLSKSLCRTLAAGTLEARWNKALTHTAEVEGKIAAHDAANLAPVTDPASLARLAADLKIVWTDQARCATPTSSAPRPAS